VSFAFNLGGDIILAGCKKTCTDLRNALRREDHTAVAEKFKEFIWAYNEKKGRKEKMRGLIKRRNEEAKLFLAVDDTLAGKPRDPKVAAK
jgi:GH24 family phage-related lysozyme (muramidase)